MCVQCSSILFGQKISLPLGCARYVSRFVWNLVLSFDFLPSSQIPTLLYASRCLVKLFLKAPIWGGKAHCARERTTRNDSSLVCHRHRPLLEHSHSFHQRREEEKEAEVRRPKTSRRYFNLFICQRVNRVWLLVKTASYQRARVPLNYCWRHVYFWVSLRRSPVDCVTGCK